MKLVFLAPATAILIHAAPVTFYKDIAPITNEYCAPCHRPGQAGPFTLLTYEDVRKRATLIAAVTKSRYMPPWLPESGYGHFADERRLTDAQIHLIQEWVATGLLAGSPADAPPPPQFTPGWQLGPPDLIVHASQPYRMAPDGPDQFWNFVLRVPLDKTHFVKAIEIRPGNARIVHHANLLVDRARTSRSREATPGAGFAGMDLEIESNTFDPDSHFLFWKPGSAPYVEPDGMAWRLDKGNDLVLNVHLQTTGKAEEVQPEVGLYFTDQPQTQFPMLIQLENDGKLNIPPGDRSFLVSDDFRLPMDVNVLAVYPHAHYLGKLLGGYATLPDGTKKQLVRIPDWDLNWQAVFRYEKPLFLPRGTVISMRFHYDNSAGNPRNPNHPPKRVVSGNQATDEMGHLWLQVLPSGGQKDLPVLQEALMRHRLDKYPADFSAHYNLGALMLAHEQPAAAIPLFRDALKTQPDQAAALTGLGAALAATDHTAEAKDVFEHALRVQPTDTNARYNLANLQVADGQLQAAAENFRVVVREDPDDGAARERFFDALVDLSAPLAANGKIPEAAALLREALTIRPNSVDVHNNLGVFLARQGDLTAATKEFEAALQIDPANREARRNLEFARAKKP
jgi:Flp pilus assembly protein TadD